jgi:hypothetical protein
MSEYVLIINKRHYQPVIDKREARVTPSYTVKKELQYQEGAVATVEVKNYIDSRYAGLSYGFHYVLIALGMLVIVVLVLYYQPWIYLRDQVRDPENVPFKERTLEERQKELQDVFCEQCLEYRDMTFEREEEKVVARFIHGKCKSCGHPIRKKL